MSHTAEISEAESLPTSPQSLLDKLQSLDIIYTLYEHPPVFTVEESKRETRHIPGTDCRNLFLRDKKKKNFLVTAANETVIDLKKLSKLIGAGRLSFGSADRLWEYLGIRQGAVNPFCIMNDAKHDVTLILDANMMKADLVAYHPMDNSMTITLRPADLLRFVESLGRTAEIVELG